MIIPLSVKDVDKIIELYDGKFVDGWNREMLVSGFGGGRFYAFGKEVAGRVVGFIGVTISADFADIESVFVDDEFRRAGVAFSLIERAKALVLENGLSKILLEVKENNLSAIRLYDKCGFNVIGRRKKYYPDGKDALIMAWEK